MNLNEITSGPRTTDLPPRFIFSWMDETHTDLKLKIDNSSLEVFSTCPRSSFYKLILSRESTASSAMNIGTCLHTELEEWYKAGCRINMEESTKRIIQFYLDHPVPEGEWRNVNLALETRDKYVKPVFPEDEGMEIVSTESSFEHHLGTVEFESTVPFTSERLTGVHSDIQFADRTGIRRIYVYWTGRRDLVERQSNGRLKIWDHKSTSMMGPSFFKDFEFAQQTVGYAWATGKEFKEEVTDCRINALAIRKPTKTGMGTTFERQDFHYSLEQQAEWKMDVLHQVNDFLAHLQRGYFPKHTKWCQGKYGMCKYQPTCSLPQDQRMAMLATDIYQNVSWTPDRKESES